jgi:hypothetical protein
VRPCFLDVGENIAPREVDNWNTIDLCRQGLRRERM